MLRCHAARPQLGATPTAQRMYAPQYGLRVWLGLASGKSYAHGAAHVRGATLTSTRARALARILTTPNLNLIRYVGLRGGQWRLALALSLDQDFGDGAFD